MPNQPYTEIQGIPVFITSNIDATTFSAASKKYYRNLLAHKSAIAWAVGTLPGSSMNGVQMTVKESEQLRKTIYTQILYGVKLRRATGGVRILTR